MAYRSVRVRSRPWNAFLAICLGVFPLIFVGAPVGVGVWSVLWVLAVLAVTAIVVWRALRIGAEAGANGILIKNLGRDYRIDWGDIAEMTVALGGNIAGAAKTIRIRRLDGSSVVAKGASSYSRAKVERWRAELAAFSPKPG
jgi:hypothetical protein